MGYSPRYYDLVLAGILASLLVGIGVGALTAAPMVVALPASALVAVGIIGHGLFVNGPRDLADEVGVFE